MPQPRWFPPPICSQTWRLGTEVPQTAVIVIAVLITLTTPGGFQGACTLAVPAGSTTALWEGILFLFQRRAHGDGGLAQMAQTVRQM